MKRRKNGETASKSAKLAPSINQNANDADLTSNDDGPSGEKGGRTGGIAKTDPTIARTGLIVGEIILWTLGQLARNDLEKRRLRQHIDPAEGEPDVGTKAKAKPNPPIDDHPWLKTLAVNSVIRIATRSVPGAVLVGGGLVLKALYDHGQTRQSSGQADKNPKNDPRET